VAFISHETIWQATANIFSQFAKQNGLSSVSIPAMGTGFGGMDAEASASAIRAGLIDNVIDLAAIKTVNLVTWDEDTYCAFRDIF